MLATDLSDAEIVLAKLAARLLPIVGLIACTGPVLLIGSLLGGIDPTALALAFAIILAVALLGCSMALALSVWARKPHEVVLVTYTFWMLVLLVWPIWYVLSWARLVAPPSPWSLVANPYYLAFAPYVAPNQMRFWDYFGFFAVALAAAGGLTVLAMWRMRPVANRGTDIHRRAPSFGVIGRITRRLPGPSLDRNPVLWREWHRSRPSRWLIALIGIVGGSSGIACVVGAVLLWTDELDQYWTVVGFGMGIFGSIIQLIFGLLMLSAVAPTSMSEERQRGSLDLLATTTLSTRAIVVGKWLGTLRLVPLMTLGPGLVALTLATASPRPRAQAPMQRPVGMRQVVFRGELLFGATLQVATILVHGALIASVGVALAVWMKRQSRAIAASVAFAVMVSVGWPIFVRASRLGPASEGMMLLSPVVTAGALINTPWSRFGPEWRRFWWMAFWDIECLVLAVGLLWLTVRTFDGCFGRIPERPRRASVLADVVVLLAALVGVGGLYGWIAIGFTSLVRVNPGLTYGVLGCSLLVAVGLLLLAARAPLSISTAGSPQSLGREPSTAILDARLFARRWWESFRLVLLLAIGPTLLGLAVTTAYRSVTVVPKVTTLADGSQQEIATDPMDGITLVITRPPSGSASVREATDAEIAARPLEPVRSRTSLLTTAFLAVLTVLAHGAAVVSLGLALGIGFRRRSRAIAASVGFFLFVTVGWPLLVSAGFPRAFHLFLASPVPALVELLPGESYPVDVIAESVWWTASWDMVFITLAVAASTLAIWTLNRRSRAYSSRPRHAEGGQPVIETVLVID